MALNPKFPPMKSDIKKLEDESNDRLARLFYACDESYFRGKMSRKVKIRWSKRMTECAGTTLCAYKKEPVTVSLSRPILEKRPLNDTLETLLHEMIHAFLLVEQVDEKEEHGPEFHRHMKRICKEAGVDMQVEHDFHDECHSLLKHVWRCNGPCRETIRRAINRVPSSSEKWFREHDLECVGTFVKIKEPSPTKPAFDDRLEGEIENFMATEFPKYAQPMSRKKIIAENKYLFDKRERRRRTGSQTDEELPKKTSTKMKVNLKNRTVTTYDDTDTDLFISGTSDTSFSSGSDSPVLKDKSKNKNKNDEDSPVTNKKKTVKSKTKKKDEVLLLKIPKYIWQCDGVCKSKSPKYGRVERLINRPPGKSEKWFLKHLAECGGTFVNM